MKYRYLGNSGLAVSTICLGTMTFGQKQWGCDEVTSFELLDTFKECGGNFIDTADKYADTISEQIIGKWLKTQRRDDFVLGTKCFFKTGDSINSRGLSRKHIISACDASLKRLQTDYIDLYQTHGVDPQTPIEETLDALDYLVKQGKVRYIGLSNQPAWKITKASYMSRERNISHFISSQYLYNLLKRDIESDIIPACEDAGMKLICWSPLSGGMLTGKYKDPKKPPKNSRISNRLDLAENRYQQWYEKSINVVNKINKIAKKHDISSATVSLAWLLKNKQVASVIIGASKTKQVIENCKAGEWVLPDEDWQLLNNVSKKIHDYPRNWIETNFQGWFNDIL